METSQIEAYPNKLWGYGVRARPSRVGGAQDGMGLGLQDRPNFLGSKFTHFHGRNVVR